jgi:2-dehydropantoate 2-reductase
MKIGVVGAGGIGGYFGGLFVRAGLNTHFLARGKHLREIVEEGLQIVSSTGSFRVQAHATSDPDEIGPVDLLLFCVKSYDTLNMAPRVKPMVGEKTAVLSLQNGIDNAERLGEALGRKHVMGGTAFTEAFIGSPGIIAHVGRPGRIIFGELNGEVTQRAEAILATFQKAGIDAEISKDIQRVLWTKFLFICGVHGISTLTRSPLGLVLSCRETRDLLEGVMQEVADLARLKHIDLGSRVVDEAIRLAESYKKQFKCSMLRDLEWRKQLEIESLNGMVVTLGEEAGLPTPLNRAIHACLKLENE